ncbi:hypothetical protein LL06_14310 [Hoeflea sp. BAL378]|uniref:hypothetical protein n=1 Tax=Hoeflea sp. BAL378 TaxID=1547437 RepID=UPI0005135331|nr:hypothetical protein [Hoeflea sp. BAL378]KGF68833.1 hypothetical protein LL06_14310 [Hoeflea sp. BAL378]
MKNDACDSIFVLKGFDAVTGAVCAECRVRIVDLDQLKAVLSSETAADPDLRALYGGLSQSDMQAIGALCIPPIVPDAILTALGRPYFAFDAVPYLVHTNFELPLMLEGRKPLAVFSDGYPSDWFDELLEPFEPYVASGQILRRIIDTPVPSLNQNRSNLQGIRDVLFALPDQEWRIDAYIKTILKRTRAWDNELERLQGSLLGYEDWQNDWWIEQRCQNG